MPRTLLRVGVTTAALAVLVALVALAVPAVQSSALWSGSIAHRAQLTSTKFALHTKHHQPRASNGKGPSVEVLAVYPHDSKAFTQGLLVAQQGADKFFIESTGLYGESTVRKVDITTGKVLTKHELDGTVFGEGVALGPDGELVMITWKKKRGYTFALSSVAASDNRAGVDASFQVKNSFDFATVSGEGWGIDFDGTHFVVLDGSSKLMFWDPSSKKEVRQVTVTFNGQEIPHINELEVANGYIYANIWYQTVIVKIDPADGTIVTVFDCSDLMAQSGAADGDSNAVLNGIAYDGDEDVFYITGKLWGRVFKVRLLE